MPSLIYYGGGEYGVTKEIFRFDLSPKTDDQ
jgi:hypothetical protein